MRLLSESERQAVPWRKAAILRKRLAEERTREEERRRQERVDRMKAASALGEDIASVDDVDIRGTSTADVTAADAPVSTLRRQRDY